MIAGQAFWLAVALLAYAYLGYPALVWVWSRLRPRPVRAGTRLPTVSVVVVAQDEAHAIERRIADLSSLDYPKDLVQILVVSDGSEDDTAEKARAAMPRGGRVVELTSPRGKSAALGEAVRHTTGEVLVFCDVRQHIPAGAVRALVAPFGDPDVGAVSGTIVLRHAASDVGRGVGLYWRYETFVRECESRIDSIVGATGALWAVRRALYEPPEAGTILDDVLVPCRVALRGHRVVFERSAVAFDEPSASARVELERKARTLAGCFQLFAREPRLLDPWRNRLFLQVASHKALRLFGPMLLAIALAASLVADGPVYRAALAAQIALYAAAFAGLVAVRAGRRGGPLAVPYTFCLLQAAVVLGFARWVTGRQPATWRRAGRRREAARVADQT